MNTCAIGDNTDNKVYNTFMKNFEEFYNDKRVPFNIYGTMSYFLHPDFEYRQIGMSIIYAILKLKIPFLIFYHGGTNWAF